MKHMLHATILFSMLVLVALTGCNQAFSTPDVPDVMDPPDVDYAKRWWNALSAEQMVAALYGSTATDAQKTAAKKLYAMLDADTKAKVNATAKEIGGDRTFYSVGEWWETLDCRLMRVAAGDGNEADPMSPYCRHYPGSDFPPEKILGEDEKAHVDEVGKALLGREDIGDYPAS